MVSWGWRAEDDCEGVDEEAGDGAGEGGGGGVFGELSAEWVGQLRCYVRAGKDDDWGCCTFVERCLLQLWQGALGVLSSCIHIVFCFST